MFDGAASNTVIAKLSTETAEVGAASEVAPHDAVAFGRGLEPATGNASVIVAVDSRVQASAVIAASSFPGAEVVVLDDRSDGLEQIATMLAGRSEIESIHILSHAIGGVSLIGNLRLDSGSIDAESGVLSRIGDALCADGDILFYGCDFAAGDASKALISQIARASRADIAASIDKTGSAPGENWTLEFATGVIEAPPFWGLDGTPPEVGTLSALTVSTPDLAVASDTGSSSTDDITNNDTPTFTGTAEANAAVTLYDSDGTTVIGTTTADGSGNWSITSSQLSEGAHTVYAQAEDVAGNTSAMSAGLDITVDLTAPSVPSAPDLAVASDTGSSSTDDITNDDTPTFTGTAEANAAVTLYDSDGTTVIGTTTADGSGDWSITSSQLSEGAHTVYAQAEDVAGNTSARSEEHTSEFQSH